MKNYYEVLQLDSRFPTQRQIRQSYKRLMLVYHPDKSINIQNNQNNRRFLQINEAYKTLMDTELRTLHDAQLKQSLLKDNQLASKHCEVVHLSTEQQSITLVCEQCLGQTSVKLNQQSSNCCNFAHCDHCGLLVKIQ